MLTIGLLYLSPTHYHLILPFIVFVLLGLLIKRIYCPRREAPINGACEPEFEAIREVFRKNFDEGWEEEGAAFAVFYKGKLVVDLWGGFMEKKSYRLWKQDTLNVLFSCTKSIAAICMATLVDKGLCNYDDRISKFWPGYSKNGKGETTISMLLEHRAGLPHFQRNITLEIANDPEGIRKLIEDERPIIEIGKDTAYHSVTYGFILDLLFQIIDPNKRNVGQFIKEEIAEKYNLDIYLGNCPKEEFRVARLDGPSILLIVREFFRYPIALFKLTVSGAMPGGYFHRSIENLKHFGISLYSDNNPYNSGNNADFRQFSQPACNGIGTARALAELYVKAFEETLLSENLVKELKEPSDPNKYDHTIGEVQNKGRGFIYNRSPTGGWQIGHNGTGGQSAFYDFDNQLAVAYLCNGMKFANHTYVWTFNRLQRKVYEIVKDIEKKE